MSGYEKQKQQPAQHETVSLSQGCWVELLVHVCHRMEMKSHFAGTSVKGNVLKLEMLFVLGRFFMHLTSL